MSKRIEADLKYIWHPYTQMKDCKTNPPIFIKRAKGIRLYDDKNRFYYDTISSWWCNVHGHNHPKIRAAINRQLKSLDHVLFAGFTHENAIRLAEKLVSITPRRLTKVFFSDNGSTAVETALKMSFQYWQNTGKERKTKFISLHHGYHGDTMGAMAVSGVSLFNELFSHLFFPSVKIPSPYCYRCPAGKKRPGCKIECIKPLESILKKEHNRIAAIILEPIVMAAGGMIVYPAEYLKKTARLAAKFNIHLILDEVATGFGRTGKMFACEHAGVEPDFMCLSKGLTSGTLPLAATLTTEKVYRAFYADGLKKKTFYHGHTYTANAIACAAALASIRIFKEEGTLRRAKSLIPAFHTKMERFRSLPVVGDVRYIGMIGAIELTRGVGRKIYEAGLKRNLVLRPLGNITYFFLPLCVKQEEITLILDRAYEVIKEVSERN